MGHIISKKTIGVSRQAPQVGGHQAEKKLHLILCPLGLKVFHIDSSVLSAGARGHPRLLRQTRLIVPYFP